MNHPGKCYLKNSDTKQAGELALNHQRLYQKVLTKKNIHIPQILWHTELPDNTRASIQLINTKIKYFYEGELSICLMSEQTIINELSFIFKRPAHDRTTSAAILLTRLQGTKEQRTINQKIAKHLKDMNTKYLLMSALGGLMAHLNIKEVYAIPAHRQPSFHPNNQCNDFFDIYNELWESYGGSKTQEDLYQIPMPLIKLQNPEKSKHRARSRHHEAIRRDISSATETQLKQRFIARKPVNP